MAATAPSDVSTDLIIVGGGPAGCAAALMAASVGTRSLVVEADALCAKLRHIRVVGNVVGGHSSGPELAAAIAGDLERSGRCEALLGVRATRIDAFEEYTAVTLDTGRRLLAPYAVVATGAGPLPVADAPWLTVADGAAVPTLWGAEADGDRPGPLLVLGADRPLGTFLRAHPALESAVLVAYPPGDDHKADEVRDDRRVELLPVTSLLVRAGGDGRFTVEWTDRGGRRGARTAGSAYLNLGSAPAPPAGALVTDGAGYCPPSLQHPRVLTAGDLRSPRFQRIMAATGSGAEAALRAYYARQDVPTAGGSGSDR
ncbi:FAD-dependent oxidoreductase [Streptomyces sp. V4-01]|uniref:FAD-dependent oxidoreductase n=1 Tax=Actinacidiphila polyblastidii TaxID=3110430 RepID=A0ABU7PK00_9ACTN|nr:FAD-dependent oxidoreductase [Streptomyces sp. V4-01]